MEFTMKLQVFKFPYFKTTSAFNMDQKSLKCPEKSRFEHLQPAKSTAADEDCARKAPEQLLKGR